MSDNLQELAGVGPQTAKNLEAAGFTDFMAIAVSSPKQIAELVEGLTPNGAEKIIESAKKLAKVGEFITAAELKKKREKLEYLTTGSVALNELFGGEGLESGTITEFYGEFGSGKTQICFQLAVNATMPKEKGGLDGHVIVIDTENTFRPGRIEQIAKAQDLDVEEVTNRIHVARAFNSAHQIMLMRDKAVELAEQCSVKLVIVDSLTSHFRGEFVGRANLGERQGLLNTHMHDILKFAERYNAVAVVTNQVITNPGQLFGDPTKPVGGNIVGHNSTYRVYLRKGKKDLRVAKMIDSPEHPSDEAIIAVSESGVGDDAQPSKRSPKSAKD